MLPKDNLGNTEAIFNGKLFGDVKLIKICNQ